MCLAHGTHSRFSSLNAPLKPPAKRSAVMSLCTNSRAWLDRMRAASIHTALSAVVAFCAAALVFLVWYPYPYREISGGRELFTLVVSVDVVLGPLLTFAVFDRRKPRRELMIDLGIIVMMQFTGLAYGLYTVALARPVHLVWEIDRMRVVHMTDIPDELLAKAPPDLRTLPLTGPTLLAVRPFSNSNERMEVTMAAVGGVMIGARPDLWQPYAAAAKRIRESAKPVSELKMRFPRRTADIDAVLLRKHLTEAHVLWLPLAGRKDFWTIFISSDTLLPVAYLPLDPF